MTGEPLDTKPQDAQMEEAPETQAFIDSYGQDAAYMAPNGMLIKLGQALKMEAAACTAASDIRKDPQRRIRYMARRLFAAGSLREEDRHLIEEDE